MVLKKTKYIFFIATAVIVLLLLGVKVYNKYRFHLEKRTSFMMDTYVTIYAVGPKKTTIPAINKAFDRMQEINDKFSNLNPDSPIYAFNQQGVPIRDEEILKVARLAGSDFNISRNMGFSISIKSPEFRQRHNCNVKGTIRIAGYFQGQAGDF